MAKLFDRITDELQTFINAQSIFFVGTAPLSANGRVNLSPKGQDSFRILGPNQVAYLDLTGSGSETSAHLLENARVTFMFCAFQEPPCILRLYGKGQVVLPDSPEWNEILTWFPPIPGTRQIILAAIDLVQTSCGFGVPLYKYQGQRQVLVDWATQKGEAGLHEYRQLKNCVSLDGLPTAFAANPLD